MTQVCIYVNVEKIQSRFSMLENVKHELSWKRRLLIYENKENHHLLKRIKSNIDLAFNTSKSLLHL